MRKTERPTGRSQRCVLAFVLSLLACGDPASERTRTTPIVAEPSDETEAPPPWAVEVGKSLASGSQLGAARRIQPASLPDRAYETNESVAVRRLVYRVTLLVPPGLNAPHPPLLPSSGELHLDVGLERLRARFIGQGWPVDDGSEVRLRSDVPGVYLFDGAGGRPLVPGQLAGWFQGEEAERRRMQLWIRPEAGPTLPGPAELVCALLAEWTDQSRSELASRCSDGTLPQAFGFGVFSADLTAIVPMTMQRSQLRADAVDLPRRVTTTAVRGLLDPRDAGRLEATLIKPKASPPGKSGAAVAAARTEEASGRKPSARLPARSDESASGHTTQMNAATDAPSDQPPPPRAANATLRVHNPSSGRALVVVQGVPLAWLNPGARAEFPGFVPGRYRVGAARPFGQAAMGPTLVAIPGDVTLGRPVIDAGALEPPTRGESLEDPQPQPQRNESAPKPSAQLEPSLAPKAAAR